MNGEGGGGGLGGIANNVGTGLYNFIFEKSFQIDAKKAEKSVRSKYPLLLHEKEKIELAYKDRGGVGRDKSYFTSHRILIKDGKGFGSKRKNYLSIPYNSIKCFALETSENLFGGDVALEVWTAGHEYHGVSFASADVDLFHVQMFLSTKVDWFDRHKYKGKSRNNMSLTQSHHSRGPMADSRRALMGRSNSEMIRISHTDDYIKTKQSYWQRFIKWASDTSVKKEIDLEALQVRFRETLPILLPNEDIHLAFQAGRDITLLTDTRILIIHVKKGVGVSNNSKQIHFESYRWSSISGYAVETGGISFDRNCEIKLYTNILSKPFLHLDFRKHPTDILEIQRYINDKLMGGSLARSLLTPKEVEAINRNQKKHNIDPKALWWLKHETDRPVDAKQIDYFYHTFPTNILQDNDLEHVDLAFKGRIGCNITLFTNKRILVIDPQWPVGASPINGQNGNSNSPKRVKYISIPWTSCVAFGAQMSSQQGNDAEVHIWTDMYYKPGSGEERPPEPKMSFLELDFNQKMIDILLLKKYLSLRLLSLQHYVEHLRPAGIPPEQIPLTSIITTNALPTQKGIEKIFGGNENDTFSSNSPQKEQSNRREDKRQTLQEAKHNGGLGGSMRAIKSRLAKSGSRRQLDQTTLDENLHKICPILLEEENIIFSFQSQRYMITLFTSYRILLVDIKGWITTGGKIQYSSVPYPSIRAYSAENVAANTWDRDTQIKLYTRNRWEMDTLQLDFRKVKHADIVKIQKLLAYIMIGSDTGANGNGYEDLDSFVGSVSHNNNNNKDSHAVGGSTSDGSTLKNSNNTVNDFLTWFGKHSKKNTPDVLDIDDVLHTNPEILLPDERVSKAFHQGRNMYVYTNERLLIIDIHGIMGKKIEYQSIPYRWIRTFEIETAGHLDPDAEIYLHADIINRKSVKHSILVSKGDIYEAQQFVVDTFLFNGGAHILSTMQEI